MIKLMQRLRLTVALERITRKVHSREYAAAENIISRAEISFPTDPSIKLARADIQLFQGNHASALETYRMVSSLIDLCDYLNQVDIKFLKAYLNFRLLAVAEKAGRSRFDKFSELAKQINALPSKAIYKDLFILPD